MLTQADLESRLAKDFGVNVQAADPSTLAAPVTPADPSGRLRTELLRTHVDDPSFTSLDVRTRAEYAAGHLAGATNIDFYSSDFRDRLAGLDKDRTYLVYCQTGNRSAQATAVMHAMGFKHVYDVQGGIAAWQQAGLPTTQIGVAAAGRPATGQMVSETVNKLCGRRSTRRHRSTPGGASPCWPSASQPARYTVYRCGMSAERIQDWFATLPPQARVDWLETGQTGVGLTAVLLRTLPEEHRPGHADAWVFGAVYPKWLLTAADSPAYVLSEQFGEFLAAEYSRWYGGE